MYRMRGLDYLSRRGHLSENAVMRRKPNPRTLAARIYTNVHVTIREIPGYTLIALDVQTGGD